MILGEIDDRNVARMQRGFSPLKLARRRVSLDLHRRNVAPRQLNTQVRALYAVPVGNNAASKSGTWATLVVDGRRRMGYTQERLAALVGVDRTTVWRWEKQNRLPDTVELTLLVARHIGIESEVALHAAGHVGPDTPEPEVDPRLNGLDPRDPVVQHILSLDVDEQMRGYMLDRRREILELRRKQDIAEVDIIARRDRGAA